MSNTIHIFNPEHDIALAANAEHWTAPHAGRQLRADLGWLPALWAADGDVVLVDDVDASREAYRRLKREHKADVLFADIHHIADISRNATAIQPWGWDLALRHQLVHAGVSEALLPTKADIAVLREQSGRQSAIALLQALRTGLEKQTCGQSTVVSSIDEITELQKTWGSLVVKAPWSSSGRGVRYLPVGEDITESTLRWTANTLRQQGALTVEIYLNKVYDFGMEFHSDNDGHVAYLGLSLFHCVNGAYKGSILATEAEKRDIMARYIPLHLLDEVQQRICTLLDGCFRNQPFGIDMMLCKPTDMSVANTGRADSEIEDNPTRTPLLLNPCVELNLRRTMGHVALSISPQQPCCQQVMQIGYEARNYHFRIYDNQEIFVI